MGADPKATKRRKQTPSNLPAVRSAQKSPLPLKPRTAELQTNSDQSRLPDGFAYEREINIAGLHNALEQLAGVDPDGYFKASLGDEGKTWFIAWRWQRGQWAGYYVMVRVLRGELGYGLQLLADKVYSVRAGSRKPTLDRYGG